MLFLKMQGLSTWLRLLTPSQNRQHSSLKKVPLLGFRFGSKLQRSLFASFSLDRPKQKGCWTWQHQAIDNEGIQISWRGSSWIGIFKQDSIWQIQKRIICGMACWKYCQKVWYIIKTTYLFTIFNHLSYKIIGTKVIFY